MISSITPQALTEAIWQIMDDLELDEDIEVYFVSFNI